MSLQLAAQHLASRGRGPDTQLIHMAPQEVAGLHALAKAHGGSLTTNPDTGLPEAGFLSSILPMVIGGALAATGIGAPLAAAMVGGGYGLATGSLSKGLMAGLGAFGGAGLAGGLMGAGAAGAAELGAGAAGGLSPTAATAASELAGTQAALQQNALAGIGVPSSAAAGTGAMSFAPGTAPNILGQTSALSGPMSVPVSTGQLASGVSQVATATPMATAPLSYADKISQMGRGFTSLGTEAGREAFMSKAGVGGLGGLAKYGMAAAAPIMFQEPKPYQKPAEEKPYEYTYSSGRRENPDEGYTGAETGERSYFDHRFVRKAAGGGLMDINPIGAMSQQNQSQMQPAYAQGGVSDTAVNAYTGAENFAEGGDTTEKPAKDPYNTMTGQSAAMYDYLMGQGQRPAAAPRAPAPVMAAAPAAPAGAPQSELQRKVAGMFTGNKFVHDAAVGLIDATDPYAVKPGLLGGLSGGRSDEPLTMSYTFDPVTGGFRKLAPTEANYAAPATTTGMGYYGDYGGDSGSAGVGSGPASSEGGGMSNSGEGGGAAGEGGWAHGGIASLAQGGPSHLGDYSDGGRLLRGPGDGVSDSIPASIGDKRPARLADGEFVVPARIVSELGNGSTEAGARKLYAMMDRVQKARAKTTGKNRVATNTKAERLLPV